MITSKKVQSDTGGMSDNPNIMRRPIPYYECEYGIVIRKRTHKCSHYERSATSISEDMVDCKNPCPIGCWIPKTVDEKFMDGA